jgi:hypothetical protein
MEKMFDKLGELNWNKTIGVDFVQEEDPYGSIAKYNNIVDKMFVKYP